MTTTDRARTLVAEQAAHWLVQLQDPGVTAAERCEFAAWLKFSPAHVYEYLNARATWEALSGESLRDLPDREALLDSSRSPTADVVVPLNERTISDSVGTATHLPTRRRAFAIAAALALLVATSAFVWTLLPDNPNRARYSTDIGQQSTHTLADGSTVVLNTNSRLRLDWSEHYRDVYLDRGEAVFDVAHDAARPFRVWTGATMVRAVGTRFNVYRAGEAVTVTVLEGRVEITPQRASPVTSIGAGEQAQVNKQSQVNIARMEQPEKVVAWQLRRLEFEGAPLSQVIAEFNRYYPTPLVLEDTALAAKRIDGTFDSSDRESLIAFLKEFEGLQVRDNSRAIVIAVDQ